jgi:hypothetical protein
MIIKSRNPEKEDPVMTLSNNNQSSKSIRFSDFIPLAVIFGVMVTITIGLQWYYGFSIVSCMSDFMASFFLIFGSFKLLHWSGFVEAYSMYDVIAKRSTLYAYAYPLIEIVLGISYALRLYPTLINGVTILIMLISSIGVAHHLQKKETIQCACLGTVFKLPMTYITLFEDVLMALMAGIMLIF